MKRLIGVTMLLVTLFLVLKHVENPLLPFSAPHMPPSLHPANFSFSLQMMMMARYQEWGDVADNE